MFKCIFIFLEIFSLMVYEGLSKARFLESARVPDPNGPWFADFLVRAPLLVRRQWREVHRAGARPQNSRILLSPVIFALCFGALTFWSLLHMGHFFLSGLWAAATFPKSSFFFNVKF